MTNILVNLVQVIQYKQLVTLVYMGTCVIFVYLANVGIGGMGFYSANRGVILVHMVKL